MKLVLENKIVNIEEGNNSNNREYKFIFPIISFNKNIEVIDLNINIKNILNNKKLDIKSIDSEDLRNIELELVKKYISQSNLENTKIHLKNISYSTSMHLLEEYYRDLGLFIEEKNGFKIDWKNVNITGSVSFFDLLYSSKDSKKIDKKYKTEDFKNILKSPQNTKLLTRSVNCSSVLGIDIDSSLVSSDEISNLLKLEKINIFKFGELINYHYLYKNPEYSSFINTSTENSKKNSLEINL